MIGYLRTVATNCFRSCNCMIYSDVYHTQAKFLNEAKPRLLSLHAFSWDENLLCGKFQGCGNSQGFKKVWLESVHPYLDQNGIFTYNHADISVPRSVLSQDELDVSHSQNDSPSNMQKKRKSQIETPPSMIPASKIVKYGSETVKASEPDMESENNMDANIQKHFIGKHFINAPA